MCCGLHPERDQSERRASFPGEGAGNWGCEGPSVRPGERPVGSRRRAYRASGDAETPAPNYRSPRGLDNPLEGPSRGSS